MAKRRRFKRKSLKKYLRDKLLRARKASSKKYWLSRYTRALNRTKRRVVRKRYI